MAKVTITFEDMDDGVQVKIESDPSFPGPAATPEQQEAMTDAQQMGIRMTELLTEELHQQQHDHDHEGCGPDCNHDHDHDA